jgi:hypothetical protein
MTAINTSITGFCAGNDLDVNRTVPGIPATQTLAKAWLTIKAKVSDADAAALLQKVILPGAVAGQGQITDVGAGGTAVLLFQLADTETLALPADTPLPYDIKVLTSAGKVYTTEKGMYLSTAQVTQAIA